MSDLNLPISFNALAIEQAGAPVSIQQKSIASLNDNEVLIRVSYASCLSSANGCAGPRDLGTPALSGKLSIHRTGTAATATQTGLAPAGKGEPSTDDSAPLPGSITYADTLLLP